jgi:crossover junction endodeoxyribonuclease RuvC
MTPLPVCIGIDPGKSGGIALVYSDGSAEAHKMPETERDLLDLARELVERFDAQEAPPVAWIEVVHAMPKQGVSSCFTFGKGYGGVRMAFLSCGFALNEVQPAKWQGALGCRSGGEKNITKRRAQELFPSVKKITHATADALLIAEYGRRQVR